MKNGRLNAIMAIITENEVTTQKELADCLRKRGFETTQATISRDIKRLNLVKAQISGGKSKYIRAAEGGVPDSSDRVRAIFSHSVVSVDCALNDVVIKTLSGMAQAAAITIEAMHSPEILGTIGGDDTVLVVTRNEQAALELTEKLKVFIV